LLVGNNIDGFVDIDIEEFQNFEDLKSRLPLLLSNLECRGEWNVKLYQITKPYRILKKYGYYKTPSHGKILLEHSYMDYPIKSIHFLPNKIQLICSCLEVIENWNAKSNEDFLNYEIDVEVKTIFIS
jgi:hypothetical protein